jgi:hypothetical protein
MLAYVSSTDLGLQSLGTGTERSRTPRPTGRTVAAESDEPPHVGLAASGSGGSADAVSSGRSGEDDGTRTRKSADGADDVTSEALEASRGSGLGSIRSLGALLGVLDRESPDLALVARAWPALPKRLRAAVLALVREV